MKDHKNRKATAPARVNTSVKLGCQSFLPSLRRRRETEKRDYKVAGVEEEKGGCGCCSVARGHVASVGGELDREGAVLAAERCACRRMIGRIKGKKKIEFKKGRKPGGSEESK